jgi:hypothetical protein
MKSLVFGIALLLTFGCATHYSIIRNNRALLFLKSSVAESVYLRSSLDGFKLHPAEESERGTWRVELPSTAEFKYFYLVDGVVTVPDCRFKEKDDFGGENCIFVPNM